MAGNKKLTELAAAAALTGTEKAYLVQGGVSVQSTAQAIANLAVAGGGAVTHTAGALTANAVVLGAGAADTKVVAGVTTDGTSVLTLGVAGTSVGGLALKNATSGTITVQPPTGALGTVTLTAPAATDTLVGRATTDTLTNKSIAGSQLTGAYTVAGLTLATAKLLGRTTAATGAVEEITVGSGLSMSAGTLTSTGSGGSVTSVAATVPAFLSIAGSPVTTAGTLAITYSGTALPVANGGTASTSGNLSSCTADGTNAVGFRQIPQNSQSVAYTTVLADGGKHIYHPSADTTARIWTIDSNANVAYPTGTAITFINDTSGGVITIAITADVLVLAGAGTTGSRTLAANGIATAVKMTSTRWMISGTGIT